MPVSQSRSGRGPGRPREAGVDERILGAALVALRRDGYAELRIDNVASEAGVSKTTVYRRWPSKEALIAGAVTRLYLDRVEPPDHGDLRSDLVALLDDTHELLFKGAGRVLEDLVRQSGASRDLAEVVKATSDARRRAFHQAMNRGVARGELEASADHDLLIDLLVGPLWTRLLVTGGVLGRADIAAIVDAVLEGTRPV